MTFALEIQEQPALILHTRPFRETSLLLEIFTRDYGRISLVARGARGRCLRGGKTYPRFNGLLQPFVPLLLSWRGRGPLFNLTRAEPHGLAPQLRGASLPSGWYMNELLMRTLGHCDVHTQLFLDYGAALFGLIENLSPSLRRFEKRLLTTLGVLPQLDREKKTGKKVQENDWYLMNPLEGVRAAKPHEVDLPYCFQGVILLAVQYNDWQHPKYWPSMKRLFRLMLDEVLSYQPIRSRDLL